MKRKTRAIVAVIVSVMLLHSSVLAAQFKDVSSDANYASAVGFVSNTGLMVGYGDGTFRPNSPVTRAEMATVMCKILGEDNGLKKDAKKFSDVPASHWGNAYVAKAASLGILSGYGNGKFGPDDTVTYEQALTMMVNAMDFGRAAGKLGGYPNGYVKVAANLGLTNNISAKGSTKLTRGNVAILLMNYSDNSTPITGYLGKKVDVLISDYGYEYKTGWWGGGPYYTYPVLETYFYHSEDKIRSIEGYAERNYFNGLSARMTYPEILAVLPDNIKVGVPELLENWEGSYYDEYGNEYNEQYCLSFSMDGMGFLYTWIKDPMTTESIELSIGLQ